MKPHAGKRICLFAQYDPVPRLAPHTRHYLREIITCGYEVHVCISGHPNLGDQGLRNFHEGLEGLPIHFYPRENGGLDFAAWQFLIEKGCVQNAIEILFTNDSLFGPITPLKPIMQSMRAEGYDAWGMVRSQETMPHLQSWFLVMTGDAFTHPAIQRIFSMPFMEMSKGEIILHGEFGTSIALDSAGLKTAACWTARKALGGLLTANPMHTDWLTVLQSGRVPFIKTELLRDNPFLAPGVKDWRNAIPDKGFFRPAWIVEYLKENPPRSPGPIIGWQQRLTSALAAQDPRNFIRYLLQFLSRRRLR